MDIDRDLDAGFGSVDATDLPPHADTAGGSLFHRVFSRLGGSPTAKFVGFLFFAGWLLGKVIMAWMAYKGYQRWKALQHKKKTDDAILKGEAL